MQLQLYLLLSISIVNCVKDVYEKKKPKTKHHHKRVWPLDDAPSNDNNVNAFIMKVPATESGSDTIISTYSQLDASALSLSTTTALMSSVTLPSNLYYYNNNSSSYLLQSEGIPNFIVQVSSTPVTSASSISIQTGSSSLITPIAKISSSPLILANVNVNSTASSSQSSVKMVLTFSSLSSMPYTSQVAVIGSPSLVSAPSSSSWISASQAITFSYSTISNSLAASEQHRSQSQSQSQSVPVSTWFTTMWMTSFITVPSYPAFAVVPPEIPRSTMILTASSSRAIAPSSRTIAPSSRTIASSSTISGATIAAFIANTQEKEHEANQMQCQIDFAQPAYKNISMIFQLENATEQQHAMQFCSNRPAGLYCYSPEICQSNCMASSVIQCPTGTILRCREGHTCQGNDEEVTSDGIDTGLQSKKGKATCAALQDTVPAQFTSEGPLKMVSINGLLAFEVLYKGKQQTLLPRRCMGPYPQAAKYWRRRWGVGPHYHTGRGGVIVGGGGYGYGYGDGGMGMDGYGGYQGGGGIISSGPVGGIIGSGQIGGSGAITTIYAPPSPATTIVIQAPQAPVAMTTIVGWQGSSMIAPMIARTTGMCEIY